MFLPGSGRRPRVFCYTRPVKYRTRSFYGQDGASAPARRTRHGGHLPLDGIGELGIKQHPTQAELSTGADTLKAWPSIISMDSRKSHHSYRNGEIISIFDRKNAAFAVQYATTKWREWADRKGSARRIQTAHTTTPPRGWRCRGKEALNDWRSDSRSIAVRRFSDPSGSWRAGSRSPRRRDPRTAYSWRRSGGPAAPGTPDCPPADTPADR